MLYSIFEYLQEYASFDFPGKHLMTYISFRAGITFSLSLLIALVFGRRIIDRLQRMQVGEVVRNLGLEGQMKKTGTPTMGGIIIIASILIPCLLVGNLTNIYMLLMIVATLWTGAIGFLDDYRKIKYHNKDGLKGKYKIIGQVGLGLIVGLTMWLAPSIKMSSVPLTTEREAASELSQANAVISYSNDGPTVVIASSSYFDASSFTYRLRTKKPPMAAAATTNIIKKVMITFLFIQIPHFCIVFLHTTHFYQIPAYNFFRLFLHMHLQISCGLPSYIPPDESATGCNVSATVPSSLPALQAPLLHKMSYACSLLPYFVYLSPHTYLHR